MRLDCSAIECMLCGLGSAGFPFLIGAFRRLLSSIVTLIGPAFKYFVANNRTNVLTGCKDNFR